MLCFQLSIDVDGRDITLVQLLNYIFGMHFVIFFDIFIFKNNNFNLKELIVHNLETKLFIYFLHIESVTNINGVIGF